MNDEVMMHPCRDLCNNSVSTNESNGASIHEGSIGESPNIMYLCIGCPGCTTATFLEMNLKMIEAIAHLVVD